VNDLQLGDIITLRIPISGVNKKLIPGQYNLDTCQSESNQVQILYIPHNPGEPWVVQEVLQPSRKWRIHVEGPFQRSFTRNE